MSAIYKLFAYQSCLLLSFTVAVEVCASDVSSHGASNGASKLEDADKQQGVDKRSMNSVLSWLEKDIDENRRYILRGDERVEEYSRDERLLYEEGFLEPDGGADSVLVAQKMCQKKFQEGGDWSQNPESVFFEAMGVGSFFHRSAREDFFSAAGGPGSAGSLNLANASVDWEFADRHFARASQCKRFQVSTEVVSAHGNVLKSVARMLKSEDLHKQLKIRKRATCVEQRSQAEQKLIERFYKCQNLEQARTEAAERGLPSMHFLATQKKQSSRCAEQDWSQVKIPQSQFEMVDSRLQCKLSPELAELVETSDTKKP